MTAALPRELFTPTDWRTDAGTILLSAIGLTSTRARDHGYEAWRRGLLGGQGGVLGPPGAAAAGGPTMSKAAAPQALPPGA